MTDPEPPCPVLRATGSGKGASHSDCHVFGSGSRWTRGNVEGWYELLLCNGIFVRKALL